MKLFAPFKRKDDYCSTKQRTTEAKRRIFLKASDCLGESPN